MTIELRALVLAALLAAGGSGAAQALSPSPHIEDMTWMELRERIQAGATTILVPIKHAPAMALQTLP